MSARMIVDDLGIDIDRDRCAQQARMIAVHERTQLKCLPCELEHGVMAYLFYTWDREDQKIEPRRLRIGPQYVQLNDFPRLLAHLVALAFADEWQ